MTTTGTWVGMRAGAVATAVPSSIGEACRQYWPWSVYPSPVGMRMASGAAVAVVASLVSAGFIFRQNGLVAVD
ncbi:hypothetical protein D3C71_1692870 [compost metagenome]